MDENTVLPEEGMTVEEPTQETNDTQYAQEEPAYEGNDGPETAAGSDQSVEALRAELAAMEQRYRSLAGVARSKDQQIEQMRKLLEELSEKMTAAEERSRPSPVDAVVTSRDVEDLGEDTVNFVRRVTEAAVKDLMGKFESRIAALEEKVNGVSEVATASAEQQFMAKLDKELPSWRKINQDPEFIEWLQSSRTRWEGFQAAGSAMDADGVLVFFKAYAAEKGLLQSDASSAQRDKRRHVAPGKKKGASAAPAAGQGTDKKIWTRAEIANFYAHGRRKYSAEEFARIERDIFKAQQEGRVEL